MKNKINKINSLSVYGPIGPPDRSLSWFLYHEVTRSISIPPWMDRMLVLRSFTPSIKFAGTHLYTWVERSDVRMSPLPKNVPGQGSNPDSSIRRRVHQGNWDHK